MIRLTINGRGIEAPEGATVLQAAQQAGIVIPTLCHHKDLTPYGGCRLCSVDVRGMRLPATSCTLLVAPGMAVRTESPELTRYRRTVLELLLVRFYDAGYGHDGSAKPEFDTQFAHWVHHYGIDINSAMAREPFRQIDSDPNPFIWVDKNKCIMCTRCVRACAEVQGRFVWTQGYRGYDLRIVAGADTTMLQARCESCGACVAHCPTGALDNRMSVKLGAPDRTVATICPYCGVGCQLYLNVKDDVPGGRLLSVSSNAKAPVNGDHLCLKGRYGYDFVHSPDRIRQPRVRKYLLEGAGRPAQRGPWVDVDWDTALGLVAGRLHAVREEQGPDAIGLLTSAKVLNEESYLMNKLARQVLGTNNIDRSAHLFGTSTVDGLETAFGLGAMSNSMLDAVRHAASIFMIGCNVTENHPVFASGIRQAVLRRKLKLIVASPVFYNIDEYAAVSLRYTRGTEAALLKGLMRIMLERGWEDSKFIEQRTEGFEEWKIVLDAYDPDRVAGLTGVAPEKLYQAAELMAMNRPSAAIWGSDLTGGEAGISNVLDIANLQMLLGNVGVSGGGVAPLRSQNNSQGASDMGGTPAFYPGYQSVSDEDVRHEFEAAWGTELPPRVGLTASEMLAAAGRGSLKAIFILGENAWPDDASLPVRDALEACEFVVVCQALSTQMSRYADVLLPGVSFAETTGTYTNTERRIQMVRQAIEPQADARPEWKVISELARRILAQDGHHSSDARFSGWNYAGTDDIMKEVAALTPIYAGVSHDRLEKGERLMWPVRTAEHPGTEILYRSQFARGRGQFVAVDQP